MPSSQEIFITIIPNRALFGGTMALGYGIIPLDSSPISDQSPVLGCPGTEVRINGDRINGLFHYNL